MNPREEGGENDEKGDGAVAREGGRDKSRRYPAGRAPWRVLPLSLETARRHGPAALKHLRWLARGRAQLLGDGPEADAAASALAARWGAELSTALHTATARQLRTSLGREAAQASAAALREAAAG